MVSILLDYSNLTPSKLNELKDTYMSTMEKLNNKTCETPNAELTWDNIFGDSIKFNDTFVEKAFFNMKDFHMDETIRELCSDLSSEMTKFDIEQSMRKDVYEKFKCNVNPLNKEFYNPTMYYDENEIYNKNNCYCKHYCIGFW
jgi:hypothetical protein